MISSRTYHHVKAIVGIAVALFSGVITSAVAAESPPYFSKYAHLQMVRSGAGVLTVEMHTNGAGIQFDARDHTEFVDAFYDIGRDRDNKIVILTGSGGNWMADIDFGSFGDVSDPDAWSRVHDEGTQVLENIANIRVPMICAVEGKAWIHTEYCLLANVIVAAEGATFNDLPHFAGGIVPGDGVFTIWAYRAGPGRAEGLLLDPKPLDAKVAQQWGVVSEVVSNGKAVARAQELAATYLTKPEVTRRNTRIHFIYPLKQRLIAEVGYGLSLEGASAAALVKAFKAKAQR